MNSGLLRLLGEVLDHLLDLGGGIQNKGGDIHAIQVEICVCHLGLWTVSR